jgi:hypothetical protein
LFLGPPTSHVFAETGGDYADTYNDIRRHYRDNQEFQTTIELVEQQALADLALTITFRGKVGTLRRTNQVNARLFVIGTDHVLDLDGLTDVDWGSFSNQAKSLLRQTVQWAAANRERLPRFSTARDHVEGIPSPLAGPTTAGLFLPPSADQTPGVEVRFQEIRRIPDAVAGTRIRYRVTTSGFPADRKYTVAFEGLEEAEAATLTDVRADGTGTLREGHLNGKKFDVARDFVEIKNYTRGEPYTVRVVSSDRQVSAHATVFPFPIHAACGDRLFWVALVSTAYDRYELRGRGFVAGEQVAVHVLAGEADQTADLVAAADGTLRHTLTHRGSGEARVELTAASCQATLEYAFGERGRAIQ